MYWQLSPVAGRYSIARAARYRAGHAGSMDQPLPVRNQSRLKRNLRRHSQSRSSSGPSSERRGSPPLARWKSRTRRLAAGKARDRDRFSLSGRIIAWLKHRSSRLLQSGRSAFHMRSSAWRQELARSSSINPWTESGPVSWQTLAMCHGVASPPPGQNLRGLPECSAG